MSLRGVPVWPEVMHNEGGLDHPGPQCVAWDGKPLQGRLPPLAQHPRGDSSPSAVRQQGSPPEHLQRANSSEEVSEEPLGFVDRNSVSEYIPGGIEQFGFGLSSDDEAFLADLLQEEEPRPALPGTPLPSRPQSSRPASATSIRSTVIPAEAARAVADVYMGFTSAKDRKRHPLAGGRLRAMMLWWCISDLVVGIALLAIYATLVLRMVSMLTKPGVYSGFALFDVEPGLGSNETTRLILHASTVSPAGLLLQPVTCGPVEYDVGAVAARQPSFAVGMLFNNVAVLVVVAVTAFVCSLCDATR